MGFIGGMKDKLGFGEQPEWQDDGYEDGAQMSDYVDDGYYDEGYADQGYADQDSGVADPLRFDAYNPNNFSNITMTSNREIKVASYDDLNDSYVSRRSTRRTYTPSSTGSSYTAPTDPTFLSSSRASSGDPLTQFDSDVKRIGRDPASRIEIVRPMTYADVEKIATAFKAGKNVAIVLSMTSADLAKRVLDFSFGVASALNGTVDKEGKKTFIITKGSRELSEDERKYLRDQGAIR